MIRKLCTLFVVGVLAISAQTGLALDNLYVVQMGDGSAALANVGTAAFVQKFSTAGGSPLSTIAMPIAASGSNQPLTVTGNSGSEGHLALSADGNYLTMGGYAATPGTLAPNQATAATINRVVGRITVSSSAVDTSTSLTDAYDGLAANNAGFRSVVSSNGIDFWMAGTRGFGAPAGSDGVRYATLGSTTSTSVENFPNGPSNIRIVNITAGQLYIGSGSNPFIGVSSIGTGLPTTSGQSATLVVGTAVSGSGAASPYDFWFKDTNTVYVADDRASLGAATPLGGGIQKWENSGGTWSLSYILNTGATGARGLIGKIDGANTVLYATTAESSANKLISFIDTGASSTASILATAPTNTVYRGVGLVPSVGLAGDYNNDGKVDAADYVIWRKNPGANGGDPAGYTAWRANFGTGGPGAGLGAGAVPEPTSVALLVLGLVALGCRQKRS